MDLLFSLALWHGLAKLRLHTDTTVILLETSTRVLGQALRAFRDKTCSKYETKETEREAQARGRRKTNQSKSGDVDGSRRLKSYNLSTIKVHTLGYYAPFIRWSGTTDGYSSQVVCCICPLVISIPNSHSLLFRIQGESDHRVIKRRYARTNKNNAEAQMSDMERRVAFLQGCARRLAESLGLKASQTDPIQAVQAELCDLFDADINKRYHIAQDKSSPILLQAWLHKNHDDPAIEVSYISK